MNTQSFSTKHIAYLEKDFLDLTGGNVPLSSLTLDDAGTDRLLHILAVADFWALEQGKLMTLRQYTEDMISGLFEAKTPLIFAIFGRADQIEIRAGTFGNDTTTAQNHLEIIKTSLKSSFQGLELGEQSPISLQKRIEDFRFTSLLNGTPSQKGQSEKVTTEQIERLIRGMFGRVWGYVVAASPAENSEIASLFNSVLNELRIIVNSEASSGIETPVGKKYKELLDVYLKKLQVAKAQGFWHTAVYLLTKERETLDHLKAVAKSAFSGKDSLPDRIRTIDVDGAIHLAGSILNRAPAGEGQFTYPFRFMNSVNSVELAQFVHLPSQEMPGFRVRPYARFHVSPRALETDYLDLGEIWDLKNKMGLPYRMRTKDLSKHGLIVGTTGSGKTNTVFHLLKEAWREKLPFLVIEPAKTEYRKLLTHEGWKDNLQIFTPGNNNLSPFRINPFEIRSGVSVQTHIDLLKAIFNASFYMWGPLPHVLEQCIHEIYLDKGWDLASGTNRRGIQINSQPTLTDLYQKVDEVVDRLGYSMESTMELKSALKTRLNSLRLGGKGLMLDTRQSIPFEKLMEKPTILELEAVGDDEEKSFLMGLILTTMYEFHLAKGLAPEKALTHITVIEEAHRLLGNYQQENPHTANVRGKAVEAFTNILAEIRAYGEGFLIAEQIPTKLAPEVIKNTNLKVMHRVVAEDDRKIMAATMNIAERETRRVVSFVPGEAAVFSEGDDGAFQIRVPLCKGTAKDTDKAKENELIAATMQAFHQQGGHLAPYRDCLKHCQAICRFKDAGAHAAQRFRFYDQMPVLVLALVDGSGLTDSLMRQLLETAPEEGALYGDDFNLQICTMIHAAERFFEWLGSQYQWSFKDVEEIKGHFLDFYVDALKKYLKDPNAFSSELLDQSKVENFRQLYRTLCTGRQPTPFCASICPQKQCLYRFHMLQALADDYYHKSFVELVNQGGEEMWEKIGGLIKEAALEMVLPGGQQDTLQKIALCFALQKSSSIPSFQRRHVEQVIDNLTEMSGKTSGVPVST